MYHPLVQTATKTHKVRAPARAVAGLIAEGSPPGCRLQPEIPILRKLLFEKQNSC